MHHVTTHGAHKITMDSKEREYQQRLTQAQAQADGNPNVMGLQTAAGVKPEPTPQISTSNNTPVERREDMSGDLALGTSMTEDVGGNPDEFQTQQLEKRLSMYTQAASNAGYSLNDRSATGGLQ